MLCIETGFKKKTEEKKVGCCALLMAQKSKEKGKDEGQEEEKSQREQIDSYSLSRIRSFALTID